MAIEENIELGEIIIIGVGIVVVWLYVTKKLQPVLAEASQAIGDAARNLTGNPQIVGPSSVVAQPLTAQKAVSIAVQLGQASNYTLSPDGKQIWFFNGTYYDSTSGTVNDSHGNSVIAFDSDGSVNTDAFDIVNGTCSACDFVAGLGG